MRGERKTMNKWPKERQAELEERRSGGELLQSIADELGVSEQMVSYHLKHVQPMSALFDMLPTYPKELLRIPDRPCALTADWHSPFFSMVWLERLLFVCDRLKVRDLAIVGDLTDFSSISHYVRKDHRSGGVGEDIEKTLVLLTRLLEEFEHVWWCYGNHEDRMPEALHGQDPLITVVKYATKGLKGKVHLSPLPTMFLGDDWRLEHPKTFSRDGARVAAAAAAIFHKNVATGHGHHLGFRYDVSGRFVGIDLGGLFDIDKQSYLFETGITTLPQWQAGFWVYSNKKVRPFADAFVDWKEFGVD